MAAPQPCCRRKAAGWRAFHNEEKSFGCFVGFVTKENEDIASGHRENG